MGTVTAVRTTIRTAYNDGTLTAELHPNVLHPDRFVETGERCRVIGVDLTAGSEHCSFWLAPNAVIKFAEQLLRAANQGATA
jgi:hypothetical protein